MKGLRFMAILTIVSLASCVSKSAIVPIGKDTYMMSGSSRAFAAGGGTLKADLIQDAAKFCAEQNKILQMRNSTSKDMVFGQSAAHSEVIFRCLDENDPENKRIDMDNVYPKTRIEIKNK
jgi:hypothetical protein